MLSNHFAITQVYERRQPDFSNLIGKFYHEINVNVWKKFGNKVGIFAQLDILLSFQDIFTKLGGNLLTDISHISHLLSQ